jgi:murein DD-endopeptidase MepM/ murein hydrolase activator NlpD
MRFGILTFLLIFAVSTCCNPITGADPDQSSCIDTTDLPNISPTIHVTDQILAIKRSTKTATAAATSPPTRTPTRLLDTPSPLPSNTSTPKPPFKICSPLEIHPLEVLPKIISDPYRPPPAGRDERHHGIDFSHYLFGGLTKIQGVVVQSVMPGVTAAAISDSFPYGNFAIIETPYTDLPDSLTVRLQIKPGKSLYTLYAHLEQTPMVALGEYIPACHPLGSVGKSGNAGVTHLHFETRIGRSGARFPVMSNYLETTTPEEEEYYILWRTSGEFRHFDPMELLLPDD